jgi:hypothetical protein
MDPLALRTLRSRLCAAALAVACASAVALANAVPTSAGQWHYPQRYGIRCQDDFQYGWVGTIDAYSMCQNFINTISGTDSIAYYFNLHGAALTFNYGDPTETCLPCGGVDSVDFYLMDTHGGNYGAAAAFGMWDWYTIAYSTKMSLGRNGEHLKVFATYACDTLATADGRLWTRWGSALLGGVKVLLGAHDLVYEGNSQKGTEFASRMQNGEPIGQSWLEAVWYADNNNHPSVTNVGANASDCWNRMGVNLAALPWEATLRDAQIGYVCWAGWNGS